jgi:site-specific DNA-cytosine methylase
MKSMKATKTKKSMNALQHSQAKKALAATSSTTYMDEQTFRHGGGEAATAWVGVLRQLRQLTREWGRQQGIALPCVGANSGFVALRDMGHRGFVAKHIYDVDEACRQPLLELFGQGPGSPTLHIGPIEGDILRIRPADLDCPDGLLSGPPCPFVAGNGARDPWSHPGMLVFVQVLVWIEDFASRGLKFFVLENVTGLAKDFKRSGSVLSAALSRLRGAAPDFEIKVWFLNAKDYTLAQHRERIYIVGVLKSVLQQAGHQAIPESPAPFQRAMPRCRLSWFLTEGLPNISVSSLAPGQRANLKVYKKLSELYIRSPGQAGRIMTCDLSRRPSASFGAKLRLDDLVQTLLCSNRQIFLVSLGEGLTSPTVHRWLTSEERCRLQGFRPELFAACSDTQRNRMSGNAFAVPVIGVVLDYIIMLLSDAEDQ